MKYEIKGEPMPVVICRLEPGEKMMTEGGSMSWMSPNMKMETEGGGLSKVFGKMFTGEKMFHNIYTAVGSEGTIAFASSFPGAIRAVEITPDHPVVTQKSAFLAAYGNVDVSVFFQKKVAAGMFGGEGFIMQKISGSGIAFIEIDGSAVEYSLAPGEQIIVDTGYLALADQSVGIDVQTVKGVKNVMFGGEGLFNTVLTGPGRVTLQTMPMSQFIGMIAARIPGKG